MQDVICIFTINLVNVGMREEEVFYNTPLYLYNKDVLEYAEIARNETESKIPYIEGCSTTHMMILSSVNGSTLAAIHRENLI